MQTNRVVITGVGLVTPIGNAESTIVKALQVGKSATAHSPEYAERGFRSTVSARSDISGLPPIDREMTRLMGKGETLLLGYHAALLALADAGLAPEDVGGDPRIGCIVGTGGPDTRTQCEGANNVEKNGSTKKLSPFVVPPTMSSGLAAVIGLGLKLQGIQYLISSACATSLMCIGEAAQKIALGKQDVMVAGGAEDCDWTKACGFDTMRALTSDFNDRPEAASRPFDKSRDGFVDASGGGMLVLEELGHALRRGAHIYAEIVGYGNCSDGFDMTQPSGEGAGRCMRMALEGIDRPVDLLLAHATSTPVGDVAEAHAIARTFAYDVPRICAPKGNVGHTLGGAGAIAAGFGLLSMKHRFVPKCVNLDELDPNITGLVAQRIARETMDAKLETIMVNAFGFGGTNASLVFQHYSG